MDRLFAINSQDSDTVLLANLYSRVLQAIFCPFVDKFSSTVLLNYYLSKQFSFSFQ